MSKQNLRRAIAGQISNFVAHDHAYYRVDSLRGVMQRQVVGYSVVRQIFSELEDIGVLTLLAVPGPELQDSERLAALKNTTVPEGWAEK